MSDVFDLSVFVLVCGHCETVLVCMWFGLGLCVDVLCVRCDVDCVCVGLTL